LQTMNWRKRALAGGGEGGARRVFAFGKGRRCSMCIFSGIKMHID